MTRFHKLLYKGIKLKSNGSRFRSSLLRHLMKWIYQCDIPFNVELGDNVYFCHSGFGCVINPKAKIGSNTMIQHRVTIGEKVRGGAAPIIGDNVFIGANAIIIGNIVIGNNSKIGAGAVVVHDVKCNDTVVGNPAHSIFKNNKEEN